jgi:hypothetical protein
MLKSGLIFLGVSVVLAAIGAVISPICVPCLALFLGVGAGYVAGLFDKPASNGATAKSGAGAGAIGGAGSLVGHFVGGAINAVVVGPEGASDLMRQLGIDTGGSSPGNYYFGVFGAACCLGLFEIVLMAGLGALGGLLWWQVTGKNMAGGAPPMPGAMA